MARIQSSLVSRWDFARRAPTTALPSREHVSLKSGFLPGKCYNLRYRAEGARVVGAGLLAFRDIASFLRQPAPLNPSARGFERAYGFGISQTGRLLRHFLYLGLNLDESGRQVYDGLLVHVAGGRRASSTIALRSRPCRRRPGLPTFFRSPMTRLSIHSVTGPTGS